MKKLIKLFCVMGLFFISLKLLLLNTLFSQESINIDNKLTLTSLNNLTSGNNNIFYSNYNINVNTDLKTNIYFIKIINNFYKKSANINFMIYSQKNTTKSIFIRNLTNLGFLRNLTISGYSFFSSTEITNLCEELGFHSNNTTNANNIDINLYKIIFFLKLLKFKYSLAGFFSVQVFFTVVKLTNNNFDIYIDINEGSRLELTNIRIYGLKKYTQDYIFKSISSSYYFLNKNQFFKKYYSIFYINDLVKKLIRFYLELGYLEVCITDVNFNVDLKTKTSYVYIFIQENDIYYLDNIFYTGNYLGNENFVNINQQFFSLYGQQKLIFSFNNLLTSVLYLYQNFLSLGYLFPIIKISYYYNKYVKTNNIVTLHIHSIPGKKFINKNNYFFNWSSLVQKNIPMYYIFIPKYVYLKNSDFFIKQLELKKIFNLHDSLFIFLFSALNPTNLSYLLIYMEDKINTKYNLGFSYNKAYSTITNINIFHINKFIIKIDNKFSIKQKYLNIIINKSLLTFSNLSKSLKISFLTIFKGYKKILNYRLERYNIQLLYLDFLKIFPISSKYGNFSFSIGLEKNKILKSKLPGISSFITFFEICTQKLIFNDIFFNFIWDINKVDKNYFPSTGHIIYNEFSISVLNSDLLWYKFISKFNFFYSLRSFCTISIKTNFNYGNSYGKSIIFPFFKFFHAGGFATIRGFKNSSLGSIDIYKNLINKQFSRGYPIGGTISFFTNIDVLFLIPNINVLKNIRFGFFMDFGNLYNSFDYFNLSQKLFYYTDILTLIEFLDFRYSIGLQFQWISSYGLLSISLANPLNSKQFDTFQWIQVNLNR